MLRVLVLSPGFPVADRPLYTPGIVETLSMIAKRHELTVCAVAASPASGVFEYRGLRILGRSSVLGALAGAFDVVWALWPNRTGLFAMVARAPLIVSLLGAELSRDVELAYGSKRAPRLLPWVLRRAQVISVGSRVMQRRAASMFPAFSITVAPMGIDAARFLGARNSATWSPGQRLRLIAVSDLSPVKRVPLIFAALDQLLARGIDATLDVFGDPRGRVLPPHARVTMHGFVEPSHVALALAEHHVFVHASAHESQGFALIEAALAGTPIASTRAGVAEELAELGAAIELVDHPAPHALAEAILRAATGASPDTARSAVRARYDVAPAAATFTAILEEAAAR